MFTPAGAAATLCAVVQEGSVSCLKLLTTAQALPSFQLFLPFYSLLFNTYRMNYEIIIFKALHFNAKTCYLLKCKEELENRFLEIIHSFKYFFLIFLSDTPSLKSLKLMKLFWFPPILNQGPFLKQNTLDLSNNVSVTYVLAGLDPSGPLPM